MSNESPNIFPREILEHIHAYITSQGFFYTKQDIANLYLALKSKPFVILAGISGTGKTQLVRQFAAAIGHEERCFLIPVRPNWMDHTDLLGYTDLNGNFRRQEFLDIILKAYKDPSSPYFIILDEMNLARVEHYFSDILSIIETREKIEKGIKSDPLITGSRIGSKSLSPPELQNLPFPENVYLIGTVNIDESTFPFSKKVLDRANVIEMSEIHMDWPEIGEETEPLAKIPNEFLIASFTRLRDVPSAERPKAKTVLRLLNQVNQILSEVDLSFGYRIRDEVIFYLIHRYEIRELVSEQEAIDFQILQKILPRIIGSSRRLKSSIYQLIQLFASAEIAWPEEPPVYEELKERTGFDKGNTHPYPRSLKKLLTMYRRIEEEGFTSFWA